GAQNEIEEQVKTAGTNLITIYAGSTNTTGVRTGAGNSTRLTADDAQLLRDLPEIEYVAESVQTRLQLIYGSQNWNTSVEGTNVDLPAIRSWPLKYGSFFTDEDVKSAAKVIILGSNVSDTLFGQDGDPTDQQIRVRNQIFKVLGVMSTKGSAAGGVNMDDQVFAPYTTVLKKLLGVQYLQRVYASAYSADTLDEAAGAVTSALRTAHGTAAGEDDFT